MNQLLSQNQIDQYDEDGYLVVDSGIEESVIDQVVKDMAPYWEGETPVGVSQYDHARIQDAWRISDSARQLAISPHILGILSELYNERPLPFQTLNFAKGTQQEAHSDSIHFNSEPFGMMCGVWIALEDIGPNQGPLVYYPGSHNLPEANFDKVGVEASLDNYDHYIHFVEELVANNHFDPAYGTIKKGQAIVWAANLLHGGSKQQDMSLSRHSQVTHYYFDGCKYWRPSLSKESRFYFEPRWIPYPGDGKKLHRLLKPVRKLFH